MKILSIDTASNLCTVAILENNKCIKEIIIADSRNHSEKIMPIIEQILKETNLNLKDINLIVCDKGPGSFTGIRIGVGTVLAFQDTLNIPCVGISSLEALAYNIYQKNNNKLICSLIDAKNNNVYWGLFKHVNNEYSQIGDFAFKNISEVLNLIQTEPNLNNEQITFIGDGAIINKNLIENTIQNCSFCDKNDLSSFSLGLAGYETYKKGIQTTIMPLYLRKSQAERALEEKLSKN